MLDIERDKILIETHQDVKWLKSYTVEHRKVHEAHDAVHERYLYGFIIIAVTTFAGLFL